MDQLHQLALSTYDRRLGLELDDLSVDGCITKAPCAGEVAGPNPVDRGKQGGKRSLITDAPRHSAGRGSSWRQRPRRLPAPGDASHPRPARTATRTADRPPDRGYDYQPVRDELTRRGLAAEIARRGLPAPIQVGQRWVVERSHAWLNAFGKLRWCTERRRLCVQFYLALACVIVIVRRLVRRIWTHYRWDTPSATPTMTAALSPQVLSRGPTPWPTAAPTGWRGWTVVSARCHLGPWERYASTARTHHRRIRAGQQVCELPSVGDGLVPVAVVDARSSAALTCVLPGRSRASRRCLSEHHSARQR